LATLLWINGSRISCREECQRSTALALVAEINHAPFGAEALDQAGNAQPAVPPQRKQATSNTGKAISPANYFGSAFAAVSATRLRPVSSY